MTTHPMETDSSYSVTWTEGIMCQCWCEIHAEENRAGLSSKVNPGELSSFQRHQEQAVTQLK